ncbi:hypothetical protein [uncultured Rhodospira sp.]|uniref:hypothetical protein n=1 Tax=uncultured Rhodospira sp. TaxID=1936189 RepID=UPI00262FE079|nr:hypothetical protein [uncultured Rhodospira sp.]
MTSFRDQWIAHVRLAMLIVLAKASPDALRRAHVLWALAEMPGRGANVSLLAEVLNLPRATVVDDLAWLSDQGLVRRTRERGVLGAMLLTPGVEVAQGLETVDGVAPPAGSAEDIQAALAAVALQVTVSDVTDQLTWLHERDLVDARHTITARGRLVAQGRETVPGIHAPSPETVMRLAGAGARAILGG